MSERTFKFLIVSIGTVAVGLVLLLLGLTVTAPPTQPALKKTSTVGPAPLLTKTLWEK